LEKTTNFRPLAITNRDTAASARPRRGSLGTLQAARNSPSAGSTGGKVIAPWQADSGIAVAPYLGVYTDWRFSIDDALPAGQPLVGATAGRGASPAA
jgi:hypothetical protein